MRESHHAAAVVIRCCKHQATLPEGLSAREAIQANFPVKLNAQRVACVGIDGKH